MPTLLEACEAHGHTVVAQAHQLAYEARVLTDVIRRLRSGEDEGLAAARLTEAGVAVPEAHGRKEGE